ncbi:MAG: sigma-54-dependent Fis family transcriptional regulator [Planctomycetes bacterium]|nr:sigma-54-dependent Fis family transcriptional regulator [Planctomycetota bacterium]
MPERVLVVDDEELLRSSIARRLSSDGCGVAECGTVREARERAAQEEFSVAVVDVRLPDGDGMDLGRELLERSPGALVIVLTAFSSVDSAVEAIKWGAYDYLTKPVSMDKLSLTVQRALETRRLRREVRGARRDLSLDTIIAVAPPMRDVVRVAREVARSDARTILLRGESGSGKSLLARAIHVESPRRDRAFVQITCTTLQDALLESELFGHERGAFTDAKAQKQGLFEIADGGTVFLDEISEMSERLQAKLLQVLDDRTFRRIGSVEDLRADVRVIAASNRNLEGLVRERRFRDDLYYRLNVIPIRIPPLRERREDIPALAVRFLRLYAQEFRKAVREVSPAGMKLLVEHAWPGNVRELKNVIERAVLLAAGPVLQPGDLVIGAPLAAPAPRIEIPREGNVEEEVERELIAQGLERSGGNLVRTAKLLGISRDTLRYRLKKFGLRVRTS